MKYQLISRQTSETLSTTPGTLNTQLIFSGVTEEAFPPGPGIYSSTLNIAVTEEEAATYVMGDFYDLALTPSAD